MHRGRSGRASASSSVGHDVHIVLLPGEPAQRTLRAILGQLEGDAVVGLAHQDHISGPGVGVIRVLVEPEPNGLHVPAPEFGEAHELAALPAPDSTARTVLDDRQLEGPVVADEVLELVDLVVVGHVVLLGSCCTG